MSVTLRLALILGSVCSLVYFMKQIRKNKLKISHSIFWILFSFALVFISILPDTVVLLSQYIGIQSPANLVYLLVMVMLIYKQFTNTVKMSKMTEQINALTQEVALNKLDARQAAEQAKEEANAV